MSAPQEELEPLGDLAASAFAAERGRTLGSDIDADARARLFGRVLVTVGVGAAATAALAGAAGTAKAATSAGVGAGTGLAGAGAGAGAGTVVAGTVASALPVKAVVGIALLAFVAGTGTGAAVHRTVAGDTNAAPSAPSAPSADAQLEPAPPKLDPTVTASAASSSAPNEAPRPSATPSPPVASSPTAPQVSPSSTSGGAADTDLAAERSLVDRARSALARGDTAACLEAVGAHQKRFPRGRLGEERELTAIQALARDNQTDAARARAARFRKTYPASVFLPSIDRIAPP